MTKRFFINKDLNSTFQEQGFVKVALCSQNDLQYLRDLFYDKESNYTHKEFHATMNNENEKVKKEIYEIITLKIGGWCKDILIDYNALFANFIFKHSNSSYRVGIHQDWSYVDEEVATSINVWLPLSETNEANGGLFVLPKSHQLTPYPRITPFEDPFVNCNNEIRQKSKIISTKPGEAIVYNSKLVHFSNENTSNFDRLACVCVMIPKESTPLHYFKRDNIIYQYNIDKEFFLSPPTIERLKKYTSNILNTNVNIDKKTILEFISKL